MYKNIKKETYSHYILSSLNRFESDEVLNIAIEIGNAVDTVTKDLGYVIKIFNKRKYHTPESIKIGIEYFNKLKKHYSLNSSDLYSICTFLKDAGENDLVESEILSFLDNKNATLDYRIYILNLFISFNPEDRIQEIINNYKNIKNEIDLELLTAKVIIKWDGSKAEKLKKLIKKSGGIKARHIIETDENRKSEELK